MMTVAEVDARLPLSLENPPGCKVLKSNTTEPTARAPFAAFSSGIRLGSQFQVFLGGLLGGEDALSSFQLPFLSEEQLTPQKFRLRRHHDVSRTFRPAAPVLIGHDAVLRMLFVLVLSFRHLSCAQNCLLLPSYLAKRPSASREVRVRVSARRVGTGRTWRGSLPSHRYLRPCFLSFIAIFAKRRERSRWVGRSTWEDRSIVGSIHTGPGVKCRVYIA